MIDETIARLEERLRNSESIPESNRQELLEMLAKLKSEASTLSKTHAEQAERIVGYTQTSTQEATREEPSTARLESQLKELSASVDGFEKSHPQLVAVVNRIAEILSNLGI